MSPHLVARELIALSGGETGITPVIGMFLGGAGLADIMLYCRDKIYPLGLPNSVSHFITAVAVVLRQVFGLRASFLPPEPAMLSVQVRREGAITGPVRLPVRHHARKAAAVGRGRRAVAAGRSSSSRSSRSRCRCCAPSSTAWSAASAGPSSMASMSRKPTKSRIEGDSSRVILDGETFRAGVGKPIFLRPAQPLSFVRIAA